MDPYEAKGRRRIKDEGPKESLTNNRYGIIYSIDEKREQKKRAHLEFGTMFWSYIDTYVLDGASHAVASSEKESDEP